MPDLKKYKVFALVKRRDAWNLGSPIELSFIVNATSTEHAKQVWKEEQGEFWSLSQFIRIVQA